MICADVVLCPPDCVAQENIHVQATFVPLFTSVPYHTQGSHLLNPQTCNRKEGEQNKGTNTSKPRGIERKMAENEGKYVVDLLGGQTSTQEGR